MTKPIRILSWVLGAAAVSALLNFVGWWLINTFFTDTWSFWTDFGCAFASGLMLVGSWPYLWWTVGDFPIVDITLCYIVGGVGWSVFGLLIGILVEMRRAGRKLLIQPWFILLCLPVAFAVFMGCEAIVVSLARRVPSETMEKMWDLSSLLAITLVQIPAFLAIITLIHALIRNREERGRE
jgi:hypothetical protein